MALDFALVTALQRPRIFFSLPTALETELRSLPEVEARARAALHFAYRVEVGREHLGTTENLETTMREAYLRAALAEFVSLDEAAVRDLTSLGISTPAPRQRSLAHPLVHAFRLLRHLNVHLIRSGLITGSRPATIRMGDEVHEVDYELWMVTGFEVAAIRELRDARHFSEEELVRLVSWFNSEQREWGAPHMLLLAIRYYCEQLVELLPQAV